MREVVSLVFGIREAKLTIAKDEGAKVDFFLSIMLTRYLKSTGGRDKFGKLSRYCLILWIIWEWIQWVFTCVSHRNGVYGEGQRGRGRVRVRH